MANTDEKQAKAANEHIEHILKKEKLLPGFKSLEHVRPEQISKLTGGKNAAVYLVRAKKGQVVIKIDSQGIAAESEAFAAWRKRGARVPDVYATGSLAATPKSDKKLKYIIERAMTTKHGVLAETAANYLAHAPEQSRNIGRLLGRELTKMHRATASRSFGEFADSWGNTAPYGSWSSYLLGFLDQYKDYLKRMKFSDEDVTNIQTFIKQCKFVTTGRYLHGDFSIRNATVRFEPLKVGIFDPNPIIGDPTWDIAVLFNNREFSKRRYEADGKNKDMYERDRQLLIGFKQGYKRKIHEDALLAAQLFQALLQAQVTEDKIKNNKMDKLDLRVRQDFIRDIVARMTQAVKNG